MAHVQTEFVKLWKPQNLALDKINSQKMFIDNIDIIEAFEKATAQSIETLGQSIETLYAAVKFLRTNISSNTTNIAALNEDIQINAQAIQTNTENIVDLGEDIKALDERIQNNKHDVSALDQNMSLLEENLRLLRQDVRADEQKIYKSVQTLTELKAINTSNTEIFKTGMLIMVSEYGLYSFDRNSTAAESNAVVIPNVGGGRWITTQVTDIAMTPRRINTIDELDALLTNILTLMSDNSTKFMMIGGLGGTSAPLYGGTAHVTINKVNNLYATVIMIAYNSDRIALYYTRTRYDGIWGRWVTLPYLDSNGRIPSTMMASAAVVADASVEEE